ncbi:uncharacterized protein METZ01_LOCUS325719, partial [marine metagenome]
MRFVKSLFSFSSALIIFCGGIAQAVTEVQWWHA